MNVYIKCFLFHSADFLYSLCLSINFRSLLRVSLFQFSVSIFHIYFSPLNCFLLSFPAATEWITFFFSNSLHNCLDKSHIDCACRLELILLFTVFSFQFDPFFPIMMSVVAASIHQNNVLNVFPSGNCTVVHYVTINRPQKNWKTKSSDRGIKGVNWRCAHKVSGVVFWLVFRRDRDQDLSHTVLQSTVDE